MTKVLDMVPMVTGVEVIASNIFLVLCVSKFVLDYHVQEEKVGQCRGKANENNTDQL